MCVRYRGYKSYDECVAESDPILYTVQLMDVCNFPSGPFSKFYKLECVGKCTADHVCIYLAGR